MDGEPETCQSITVRTLQACMVLLLVVGTSLFISGCQSDKPKPYGRESRLLLSADRQIWAIAPVVNLSGRPEVDPVLQADLLYKQLQSVQGLTIIPVDRTIEAMVMLQIAEVNTEDKAMALCEVLGTQGIIVSTVTQYHPYAPPRIGASLQLFRLNWNAAGSVPMVTPRELATAPTDAAAAAQDASIRRPVRHPLAVGMFDAADGSTRQRLLDYARGRNDPNGPMGEKIYLQSIDLYAGFVYRALLEDLLGQIYDLRRIEPAEPPKQAKNKK